VSTALGYLAGIHYSSVSMMFGAGLLMLWLLLAGYRIRNLPARAILSLTGHLRTRPDPGLEGALRSAFAEFDRELSAILHDRSNPVRPAGPAQPARRVNPGSPSCLPQ
jgi:hypothetical protein